MKKFALVILLLLPFPCFANLGDTEQQCASEYGQPVRDQPNVDPKIDVIHLYAKDGFDIIAYFSKGHAIRIYFQLKDKSADLSDEIVTKILDDNSSRSPWEKTGIETDIMTSWKRGDGGYATVVRGENKGIMVESEK